ncbi:MAG: hypothetical protein DRQ46_00380 [Gammaproteobacteria bacterium]|nr:MAG: hypothetical protein DRQ46_00380 [Gammaproteobacteria bacterium]
MSNVKICNNTDIKQLRELEEADGYFRDTKTQLRVKGWNVKCTYKEITDTFFLEKMEGDTSENIIEPAVIYFDMINDGEIDPYQTEFEVISTVFFDVPVIKQKKDSSQLEVFDNTGGEANDAE